MSFFLSSYIFLSITFVSTPFFSLSFSFLSYCLNYISFLFFLSFSLILLSSCLFSILNFSLSISFFSLPFHLCSSFSLSFLSLPPSFYSLWLSSLHLFSLVLSLYLLNLSPSLFFVSLPFLFSLSFFPSSSLSLSACYILLNETIWPLRPRWQVSLLEPLFLLILSLNDCIYDLLTWVRLSVTPLKLCVSELTALESPSLAAAKTTSRQAWQSVIKAEG